LSPRTNLLLGSSNLLLKEYRTLYCLSIYCLSIYCSTALCWTLAAFSIYCSFYAVGGIPYTRGGGRARRKAPYLHTGQIKQNKRTQICIPQVGFEPTIPVFERAKTVHALDRAVTVNCRLLFHQKESGQILKLSVHIHEASISLT
jgi:hypothetical protein